MLKKACIIFIFILSTAAHVVAVDLPANIICENIVSVGDKFLYLTQDSEICCVQENVSKANGIIDYSSKTMGTYFSSVKSLCEGYTNSIYLNNGKILNGRLFIRDDGSLWGYNVDNGIASCDQIEGIEGCIKACTGRFFAIALLSDGTVYTWGNRYYGEDERSALDSSSYIVYPEKVEGLKDIVDIAVRDACAYALDCDGYVYAWGENIYNYSEENGIPQKISGIEDCVEIDHGFSYLLARKADGKVYQLVDRYELGLSFPKKYYIPTLITEVDNCTQISAAPFYREGLMLSNDKKILYYEGSIFNVLIYDNSANDSAEMHSVAVSEFGNPVGVAASTNYYVIMDNGSIWRMIYNDDDDHPEYKCAVPANPEDKIKIDSIRFVKRSEAAERISSLYDELTGAAAADTESCTYSDVDTDSKYLSAIGKCCSLGLMNGTDENSFSPNKVLRREQLAVIIDRLLTLTEKDIEARAEKYTDDEAISEWAKESVYKTAGLFDRKAGSCAPQEYVSYDELETIIEKVRGV